MPLALELLIVLAGENAPEEKLIEIAENVRDRIVEHLYEALYEKLNPAEKNLLAIASLLKLPFTKNTLIELNRTIFNNNAASQFVSLRKNNLLVELDVKYYSVPEILAELVLLHGELDIAKTRKLLAEKLLDILPDDYLANCEAFLLLKKAEEWNRAAEVASDLINRYMLVYEPKLAEEILDLFDEGNLNAERWMWIVGDKGLIASRVRQYDKAEVFYSTMLDLADNLKSKHGQSLALQRLGALHVEKGDDIKAEEFYRKCLKLKIELVDLNGQAEIHNNLGLIYSQRKDFELAAAEFEAGLDLRRREKHPEWEYLPLYSNLGILYARRQDWERAFDYSRKALKIAEDLQSPYDISKSLYNLALHLWDQGNIKEAREKLSEVIQIAEKYDLDEVVELACIALGRLYADISEFEQAILYFERVARIYEKYEQKDPLCKINFDIGTCYAYSNSGPNSAVNYYLTGIELLEFLNDEKLIKFYLNQTAGLAKKLEDGASINELLNSLKKLKRKLCQETLSFKLALIYETLGEIYFDCLYKERIALACFWQAIKLFEQLDRRHEIVTSAIHLGTVCEEVELYTESLKANRKAAEGAELYGFSDKLGEILYNTGNVYTKIELYSEAVEHYKKAEAIALQEDNNVLLHSVRHNLGENYRRQGKLEDALEILQTALSFARDKNNITDMVYCLNSLGLAYEQLGLESEALTHWHEAVGLCRKNELYRKESNTLISIGNFYWRKEQHLQTKNYYEQAFQTALKAGDIEMEEAAMISLAEAHRRLGTFTEVEKEFVRIAERADQMGNYEHLIKFLAVAGVINLEDGEPDEAAKMFEQALTLSYWRILDFLNSTPVETVEPFSYLELPFILSRLEGAIERMIEIGKAESAKTMYEILKKRLESKNYWNEDNFINDILKEDIEILLPV